MSVVTAQSALFPDLDLSASSASSAVAAVGKRGRGATPVVKMTWTAPELGPTGRKTLEYEFRPLAQFRAPLEDPANPDRKPVFAIACNLIAEYFQAVGGFRTATNHVVNAWCRACVKYGIAAVRGAIHAKAASLKADHKQSAGEKRIFVCRADRFADPEIIEGWIAKSTPVAPPEPEGARLLRAARLRDHLNAIQRTEPQSAQSSRSKRDSGLGSPGPLTPDPDFSPSPSASSAPSAVTSRLTHRLATANRDAAHHRKLWARLNDVQRRAIEREGYPVFDEQVHDLAGAKADPHDVRFDDWQLEVFVGLALRRWPTQMLD